MQPLHTYHIHSHGYSGGQDPELTLVKHLPNEAPARIRVEAQALEPRERRIRRRAARVTITILHKLQPHGDIRAGTLCGPLAVAPLVDGAELEDAGRG